MKSLRNLGLAVVLSLGASQGFAMAPVVAPEVVKQVVKTGFWKSALESVKSTGVKGVDWTKKTFTKDNAKWAWTSCKDGIATGYNATSDFVKKHGKNGVDLVKKHPYMTSAILAGIVTTGVLAKFAHKYSWFGKVKAGLANLFGKMGKKGNQKQDANIVKESDKIPNHRQMQLDDLQFARNNHTGK